MKKKILVVDNNPVILRILSHHLERQGHEIKTAVNGLAALGVLETYHPDIIITDLIMPQIGGDILCRIIRSRPECDHIVLIILSAVAAEEQVDFIRLGANACVAKGPAREMEKHISSVIEQCGTDGRTALTGEVLGQNDVCRREITSELLITKKHFEVALEHMDAGFIELLISARIIYANVKAAEFFNLSVEKLVSSLFHTHFHNDLHQKILDCIEKIADKTVELGEDQAILLNGKFVLLKFIPVEEHNQRSLIVLIRDITRRVHAEMKLKEHLINLEETVGRRTEEYLEANRQLHREVRKRNATNEELEQVATQLRTTLDMIPDCISVHDENMKFVRVNRALTDAVGKTAEELIGRYCYEFMHDSLTPPRDCPHLKARQQGVVVTAEVDDLLHRRPMLLTCAPCYNEDGGFIGTVHIARDISSQKAEAADREELILKLQEALSRVKLLSGIIPICASCKNIRDDKGYWKQVESYIRDHSEAQFSHSICPECAARLYPEIVDKQKRQK